MQGFERRAEWIWRHRGLTAIPFGASTERIAEEANRYVYFRRTFEIADAVKESSVYVSADGRYQLFVNGRMVGRGPARCSPSEQCLDPYDLTPYLQTGRNVIAALAHSYGRLTAWYELPLWEQARAFGCGGFFLQGEAMTANDSIRLDTNDSWRFMESRAWRRDTPSGSLGFIEIYDAREALPDWTEINFDDAKWKACEVLRVPGRNFSADVVPFPVLVTRDIPQLREEFLLPHALAHCGEVLNANPIENQEIAARFELERLSELNHCQTRNIKALLTNDGAAEFTTTDEHGVSIILDFGQTFAGHLRFDLEGATGAVVDYTYGERLLEDGRVRMSEGIPGFDVRPAHRYTLREGAQSFEALEPSGFRYLQVTFRRCATPLRVRSIVLNSTSYPVEQRGEFFCSDERLNRIWQVGAETVRLCMHDAYIDCPSREQRQWMGDAYIETLVNYAVFGDSLLAARMLRQMAQSQRADGLTMMAAPGDFAVMSFTNIPDFCLYWIMALGRYVEYVGDEAIVHELYPSVIKAISWFERFLNAEDLLTDVPHWVFIDWAELNKMGQVTALNAQFVAALRVAADLALEVGALQQSEQYMTLAGRVATSINEHLWDEARGVYVDARQDGLRNRRISQQANSAVVAFEVAPRERWSKILTNILDDERLVLTRTGDMDVTSVAFDEERDIVLAQPFYSHHLHRALSKAGLYRFMLENIKRRWGSMIEEGAKTFRETWQINNITSLCHGWSATPTYDLSTEVLGVTPLTPGFKKFRVAPHPENLMWARGAFPTPHGDIKVAWEQFADRFELFLDVPTGTEAEIICPMIGDKPWSRIEVDGNSLMEGRAEIKVMPGTHRIIALNNVPLNESHITEL